MTYKERETSRYVGAPVECYLFTSGTDAWAWTTGNADITVAGVEYTPSDLFRGALTSTDSATESGALELSFPPTHEFAAIMLGQYGSPQPMRLEIRATHREDPDTGVVTLFIGESAAATLSVEQLKITFTSAMGRLSRRVPRLQITRLCPYMLYDNYCNVPEVNWQWSGVVAAVTGKTVTVTGLDAHAGSDKRLFANGVLRKGAAVVGFIERQDGDTVTLLHGTASLKVGDNVTLSPGCDRTLHVCRTRFNNGPRFGGHPLLPSRGPFSGDGLATGTAPTADGTSF